MPSSNSATPNWRRWGSSAFGERSRTRHSEQSTGLPLNGQSRGLSPSCSSTGCAGAISALYYRCFLGVRATPHSVTRNALRRIIPVNGAPPFAGARTERGEERGTSGESGRATRLPALYRTSTHGDCGPCPPCPPGGDETTDRGPGPGLCGHHHHLRESGFVSAAMATPPVGHNQVAPVRRRWLSRRPNVAPRRASRLPLGPPRLPDSPLHGPAGLGPGHLPDCPSSSILQKM